MSKAKPVRYRFDNFEVDIACKSLYENGVPIPLQEKPFLFLATLLQGEGAVVTRAELSMRLWPDTYVQVSGTERGSEKSPHGTEGRRGESALHRNVREPRLSIHLPDGINSG